MYWRAGATARAVEDAGLRATIGAPLIDVGDAAPARAGIAEVAERGLERDRRAPGELVRPGPRPARDLHGERAVAALDRRGGREKRGLPVQIHLSETEDEVTRCVSEHGVRPAQYLDRLGLLGPRTVLAHGVWLDDAELELIAGRGATVVTNPVANLKLAVGRVFPYLERTAARRRASASAPTGAGSNNSLDLLPGPEDLRAPPKARGARSGGGSRAPRPGRWRPDGDPRCSVEAADRRRRAGRLPAAARGRSGARDR